METLIKSSMLHIFASLLLCLIEAFSQTIEPQEVCPWESLKATCQPHQVVVMETAMYGRMKLGRCVRNDLGYIGCADDVMDIMDTLCSGRRRCEVTVPNTLFGKLRPCLEDLVAYLEASYRCQDVITQPQNKCKGTAREFRIGGRHGFLSSSVAMATSCGSTRNPWVIVGEPGQRINITLHNFNLADIQVSHAGEAGGVGRFPQHAGDCVQYATLYESNARKSKLVCANSVRLSHVYTSVGNTLEVRMHVPVATGNTRSIAEDANNSPQFLLEYQVLGCPDPPVPAGASYQREGHVAVVRCSGGRTSWQLTCDGEQWTGTVGVCTVGSAHESEVIIGSIKLPSGLSIAIIIVISLLIGCVILGVGLLCLKRQQRRQQTSRELAEQTYKSTAYSEYSRPRDHGGPGHAHPGGPRETNEYASIWEWPLPPPPVSEPATAGATTPGKETYSGGGYQHNYRDGSVSSLGDHTYQLPDTDVTSGNAAKPATDVLPRYFELDPSNEGLKSGSTNQPAQARTTGTGAGSVGASGLPPTVKQQTPNSPNFFQQGHYSN